MPVSAEATATVTDCTDKGAHVAYPGARFCARCGVTLPSTGPWKIDADEQAVVLGQLSEAAGRFRAWTAGLESVFAITHSSRLIRLHANDYLEDLGTVPSAEGLVAPLLGTRRGVYLVYPDRVVVSFGGERAVWNAPDGARFVGATTSSFGDLWVVAIAQGGELLICPAGCSGLELDYSTRIPGFDGDPSSFLTLAVQSSEPFRGEALIWGNGKAALCVDGAVTVLRHQAAAPKLPLSLVERLSETLPFAQPPWRRSAPLLLPAGAGRPAIVQAHASSDQLITRALVRSGERALAAVMTARGSIYVRLGAAKRSETLSADDAGEFASTDTKVLFLPSGDAQTGVTETYADHAAEEVLGVVGLGQDALFIERAPAAESAGQAYRELHALPRALSTLPAPVERWRALPLLPPLIAGGRLLFAGEDPEGRLISWRRPISPC